MRLSEKDKKIIKKAILSIDPLAQIFLFGSRADPRKKGGDIDILVLSSQLKITDKATILHNIFKEIEEQKIDIVIEKDQTNPFVKMIMTEAILL